MAQQAAAVSIMTLLGEHAVLSSEGPRCTYMVGRKSTLWILSLQTWAPPEEAREGAGHSEAQQHLSQCRGCGIMDGALPTIHGACNSLGMSPFESSRNM